jgi:glycosyltransferase involved in cell wall biosynthesis
MKVLYISYDGMTDSLGQSQVLPYLKELSKMGCEFHILSLEKEDKFQLYKTPIQVDCDKARIKWHPLKYSSKIPVLSAYTNFKKLKRKSFKLHDEVKFDIVHCRSDIPGIIGHHLQKNQNVKFLFDMRGFWADERVEGKIWNKSNPIFSLLYSYFKKKETTLFREADAIISLTKKGKEIITNMPVLSNYELDINVIPCCVDLNSFHKREINDANKETLRLELNIQPDTTVIGYLGSIGTWYMLDEMLQFYAIQRNKLNRSVFLFVSGEPKETIQQKARKYDIPAEEIIITSTSHDRVPLHVSLFDYSLFFIRPTFSKSASSPTKQGELMAMEVPIICNSGVGDTDEIVHRYHAGAVLNSLNQEEFEAFDLKTIEFDAADSRSGAEEWYSLIKGSERYLSVYERITNT